MKFSSYLNESEDVWKYFEKHTDLPIYDNMIENPDYFKRAKKLSSEIVMMTPVEYHKACAKIHKSSFDKQMSMVDYQTVDRIVKSIKEKQTKMKLPLIDYAYETQEGRHRAVIASKLGLKKFPVLVVNKYEN